MSVQATNAVFNTIVLTSLNLSHDFFDMETSHVWDACFEVSISKQKYPLSLSGVYDGFKSSPGEIMRKNTRLLPGNIITSSAHAARASRKLRELSKNSLCSFEVIIRQNKTKNFEKQNPEIAWKAYLLTSALWLSSLCLSLLILALTAASLSVVVLTERLLSSQRNFVRSFSFMRKVPDFPSMGR